MDTVCTAPDAIYSTVVPRSMFRVPNAGKVVVAVERPSKNLDPLFIFNVPVLVTWLPLSLNTLFDVTSPIVNVVTVIVDLLVTATGLFTFKMPKAAAPPYKKTFCVEVPLRLMVLVVGGVVKPPPTAVGVAALPTFPPILITALPAISTWFLAKVVAIIKLVVIVTTPVVVIESIQSCVFPPVAGIDIEPQFKLPETLTVLLKLAAGLT